MLILFIATVASNLRLRVARISSFCYTETKTLEGIGYRLRLGPMGIAV